MVRDPQTREELAAAIRDLERLLVQVEEELCVEVPEDGDDDEHD